MKWELFNDINEVHAFVMGWGDGVAFNRGDDLYIHEVVEKEPWYYKAGLGVGRLTWLLIIIGFLLTV